MSSGIRPQPWRLMPFAEKYSFPVRALHPVSRQAPNAPRNRSPRPQIARPSGRQDSNLRPLVPQTSPHFPISAEFDLEWFRGELVGMTTRARVMEYAGITEKYLGAL